MGSWDMEKRFVFRGSALASAAQVHHRGERKVYPVQAPCVLPTTGGECGQRVVNHNIPGLFSYERAETRAEGFYNKEAKAFQTTVSARVEGLQFKAEGFHGRAELGVSLESNHTPGVTGSPFLIGPPRGGLFLKLELYDRAIEVHFDKILMALTGFTEINNRYASDRSFREKYRRRFFPGREEDSGFMNWFDRPKPPMIYGKLAYSLVDRIHWADSDKPLENVKFEDNAIHILGFGSIFLAEIIRGTRSCRLSMMRLSLKDHGNFSGSKRDGEGEGEGGGTIAEVESNGMDIDP